MGLKQKFRNFVDKIIDTFMGETASQKANKTLKMIGLNIFSNLIICGKLPTVPDRQVYFLSLAELERLRIIFSSYNENAAKVKDSVLSPIIARQIESNKKIMECFKNIENAINKIPIKGSVKSDDIHKKCFKAVEEMINYMYGLRAILASKVEQNSIKGYVNSYLDVVLKAKPDGGVYWEEFLIWLSKIIDPNLVHLGELKTKLLKVELSLDDYKKIETSNKKTSVIIKNVCDTRESNVIIEEVRAKLVNEYKNRDKDKSSDKGGIGQTLEDILSGKTKEKIVNTFFKKGKEMGEQAANQVLGTTEIKLMSKLSGDEVKFMGFKCAKLIISQLEGYSNAPAKNKSVNLYTNHNQIINQVVPILKKYIDLKKSEIKEKFMKCSNENSAVECLKNIKSNINTCFTNLKNVLNDYKNKKSIKEIQNLYLENISGVGSKELEKFLKVKAKSKKVMFFEEYVYELYRIAENSITALDKVVAPEFLYIDTNALQINSAKFSIKDKKWETFHAKYGSRSITQGFISKLEKMEKEIGSNSKAVNKLKSEYSSIKSNWEKCNGFYAKYADKIKDEKEKTSLENIVKEIGKLSENIESKFSKYEENAGKLSENIRKKINEKEMNLKSETLKSEFESFCKSLTDLETGERELKNLKSNFESKVTDCKNFVENIKSENEKQLKELSNEFNKIAKYFKESFESINEEYEELKKLTSNKKMQDKNSEIEDTIKTLKAYYNTSLEKAVEFNNTLKDKGKEVFDKQRECGEILKNLQILREHNYEPQLKEMENLLKQLKKQRDEANDKLLSTDIGSRLIRS